VSDFARIDALIAAGQNAQAREAALAFAARDPQDLDAHFYVAKCEWAMGALDAAQAALDRIAGLGADQFAAFHLLNAQIAIKRADAPAAIAALQRAVAMDAALPDAWFHLAHQWSVTGDHAAATDAWQRYAVLSRSPDAWVHLGRIRAREGDVARAAEAYRAALSIDASHADALRAMGALAAETFDFATAKDCLQRLLVKLPGDEGALNLLGFVHGELGEDRQAFDALHAQSSTFPSVSRKTRAALYLPQVTDSREHIAALRTQFADGLEKLENDAAWIKSEQELFALTHSNFLLAYHGEDDLALQRRYGQLIRGRASKVAPQWLEPPAKRPHSRIRVGFLSSFFRQCTIGNYFEHWITGLDPRIFERFVFSTGWQPDALGERLRAAVDRFEVLRGGALDVARAVRDAQLDILVYPEVGMGAQNCLLAHLRLAPLQCAAWGHPVTTGSAEIDVFLSCSAMEPEGTEVHYAERLIGLPGIGTHYARPTAVAAFSRASMNLPSGAHLYVCPQSLFKVHPDNDDLFLDIAARDSNAVFLFFQAMYPAIGAAFSRRIALRAEQRGIDARGRFRFVPRQNESGFRAILAQCDVVLDTLHWSGGNTSLDALAVAAPVVTLPGQFMRGRQTMAMLELAGVPELIASSRTQYVDTAIAIASDATGRDALRARLAEGSNAVFDQHAPIRALGETLEALNR
jgi:CRISPR-associated protein Csy1